MLVVLVGLNLLLSALIWHCNLGSIALDVVLGVWLMFLDENVCLSYVNIWLL
ncbi:hypothetical protein Hdeb2414_s0002g00044591 [Helianthus debilis subsp. tardiflorus]